MNKKLKNAFLYALIVAGTLNLLGFLFNTVFSDFNNAVADFKHIGLLSISIFYVPCFFTVVNFKVFKEGNIPSAIKPILITFLLTFIVVYIVVVIQIYLNNRLFSFINNMSLFNAVISGLISIPSYLIYYLLNKRRNLRDNQRVFPVKNAFIAWVIVTIFYLALFSLFSVRLPQAKVFLICIGGLLSLILVYLGYTLAYKKNYNSYYVFSVLYTINILILPYFVLSFSINNSLIGVFRYVQSLVLISPYFLTLMLVIHANFIYINNKKEKQELKQIGVEASLKYQQLKAQISPHFLFNNISVLTGLIEEKSNNAAIFSQNLSQVYRYFLNQEKKDLVSLKDELDFANTYLDLLKIRFQDAIIVINETKNISGKYILPLALQQVIENIIKYNEVSVDTPVAISLQNNDDYLEVTNNINPKMGTIVGEQVGLKNIKDRYSYFTDEQVIINQNELNYSIKLPLLKREY